MAGKPAVLLLMEGIHLVYPTCSLSLYSERVQGVIAVVAQDAEIWHLARCLMADAIVLEHT